MKKLVRFMTNTLKAYKKAADSYGNARIKTYLR